MVEASSGDEIKKFQIYEQIYKAGIWSENKNSPFIKRVDNL